MFQIGIIGKPNTSQYNDLVYAFSDRGPYLPHENKHVSIETYFTHRRTEMERLTNYGKVRVSFIEFYPQSQWITGNEILNINLLNSCDYVIGVVNPEMENVFTFRSLGSNLVRSNRYQGRINNYLIDSDGQEVLSPYSIDLVTNGPITFRQPWQNQLTHTTPLPREVNFWSENDANSYYQNIVQRLSQNDDLILVNL